MPFDKLTAVVFMLLLPLALSAQKVVTVSGEYVYYPPDTESYEVSKHKALRRAQMQILADNFGTVMNAGAATVVTADSGNSEVSTFTLGESLVKGEWLETIGEPEFKRFLGADGMLGIKVTIKGKAREVTSSSVDFEAKVLRNGVEDKFESLDFYEGDDLYLTFEAPLDGYLAVYLYDGGADAYCLLPYISMNSGVFAVRGGEKYVLFSSDMAKPPLRPADVDEFTVTCSRPVEVNRIYCIYSPDFFSATADAGSSDTSLPREIAYTGFQRWLSQARMRDVGMKVQTFDITIRKKTDGD